VRVAPAVVLSPEERATLLRWARRPAAHDARAQRARIILEAANGRQDLEIARRLGVGRLTAARWRRRFLSTRLRGIDHPAPRSPRRGGIPEAKLREILRDSARASSFGSSRVSTRSLARRFGVSHTTVRRVWDEFGVRPTRWGASPVRPDPALPLEPHDVVGLYLRPPDFAIAFTLGPAARPRATSRSSDAGVAVPGLRPELPRELDSFSPSPLPVLTPPRRTAQRVRDLLRFVAELEGNTGRSRPVRLVVTLPHLGSSTELREWLARRPNFRLHWSEDSVTWKARVHRELERSARLAPTTARRLGRLEATRAIGLFLNSYSAASGPFQWVASAGEIAASGAGARLRYDLSVTGHPGFKNPSAVQAPVKASIAPGAPAREMARVVLRKCLGVRPGEHVTVESWSETLEYANAFVLEAHRLRARPLLVYQDEPTYWAAVAENRPSDLARVGDHLRAAIAKSDALVTFFGPSDRERAHALPWSTRYKLGEYPDVLYGAAAKAGTRAVQLALGRVSAASARMYGVDLATWKEELVAGTSLDPGLLHRRARRLSLLLREGTELEISHPNGTRLRLGLRHRRPAVSDGRVPPARAKGDWSLVQLPAGVVSVALDERVADGTFRSNVLNSVGVFDTVGEVEGGRWTFESGRLVRFAYDRGQELFSQSYERGGAGKDRVGILSVGLNDRISMAPLLLDQGAGTLTLQLGRNDTAGGTNTVYWWAWLILRGADLTVDGTALVKAGRLVDS